MKKVMLKSRAQNSTLRFTGLGFISQMTVFLLLAFFLVADVSAQADAGAVRSFLYNGDTLKAGKWIASPDTHARLVMQGDGNLVLYDVSNGMIVPKWASNTINYAGAHAVMQANGDFVVLDPEHSSEPVWASHTGEEKNALAVLVIQDDGNLVIYNSQHEKVWESATKF